MPLNGVYFPNPHQNTESRKRAEYCFESTVSGERTNSLSSAVLSETVFGPLQRESKLLIRMPFLDTRDSTF